MKKIDGPGKNPELMCAHMKWNKNHFICLKEDIKCIHPYCAEFASRHCGWRDINYHWGHYEVKYD